MAIVINGSGTVTGLAVGGLPDGTVDAGTLATDSVTEAKIATDSVTEAKIATDSVTTTKIPAALENTFVSGRKNEIQNGDFRINQRGAQSWPHSYQFSSDRWQNRTGSSVTWSHNTSTFPGGFTVSAECDAAGSTAQMIELDATGKHGRFVSGSTYTLSCWSTVVPTSLVTFSSSYGPENSNDWTGDGVMTSTGETSNGFTKYTQTLTVASSINGAATGVFVKISGGSAFKFTGVQLEKGSVATDFEHRSYGEELALCQRYYYAFLGGGQGTGHIGIGHYTLSNYLNISGNQFPVTMRTAPSYVITNGSSYWNIYRNDTPDYFDTIGSSTISKNNWTVVGSTNVSGTQGMVGSTALGNAAGKLHFDAEL